MRRLKPLMVHLISPEKTKFVEGRKIMDGIVATHEVIHSLKTNKMSGVLVKMDLSKAYDRICWRFLFGTLEAFCFSKAWIRWIKAMVSTPFYSIPLNGTPMQLFRTSRGLHQGDSLSLFSFILVDEGL